MAKMNVLELKSIVSKIEVNPDKKESINVGLIYNLEFKNGTLYATVECLRDCCDSCKEPQTFSLNVWVHDSIWKMDESFFKMYKNMLALITAGVDSSELQTKVEIEAIKEKILRAYFNSSGTGLSNYLDSVFGSQEKRTENWFKNFKDFMELCGKIFLNFDDPRPHWLALFKRAFEGQVAVIQFGAVQWIYPVGVPGKVL